MLSNLVSLFAHAPLRAWEGLRAPQSPSTSRLLSLTSRNSHHHDSRSGLFQYQKQEKATFFWDTFSSFLNILYPLDPLDYLLRKVSLIKLFKRRFFVKDWNLHEPFKNLWKMMPFQQFYNATDNQQRTLRCCQPCASLKNWEERKVIRFTILHPPTDF